MVNNKNGLGIFGWSKREKEGDQKARANKAIDTFIAEQKVKFGIADMAFAPAKTFTKSVNDYVNALTDRKYYSDDAPQYEVAVWDNRMNEELGRFLTEAKMFADSSFDGTLEKLGEIEKAGKSWTGRNYKYKTPIYKLKIPVVTPPTNNYPPVVTPPTNGYTPVVTPPTGEITQIVNPNQNNNMATVDTSGSSVNTAYVAGGAVLVIGLLGAVLASKLKNKNKS